MNPCFLQLHSFPIILHIVGSQIEIERIFFLMRIFINFRRCHLQSINLDNQFLLTKIGLMTLGLVGNHFLI
jgi:hypothetical protein